MYNQISAFERRIKIWACWVRFEKQPFALLMPIYHLVNALDGNKYIVLLLINRQCHRFKRQFDLFDSRARK